MMSEGSGEWRVERGEWQWRIRSRGCPSFERTCQPAYWPRDFGCEIAQMNLPHDQLHIPESLSRAQLAPISVLSTLHSVLPLTATGRPTD